MAAAIGHAARRLGGRALQRAHAIYAASFSMTVQEVQRRLHRTVWPVSSRRFGVAQPTKKHPSAKVCAHMAEIQQKKEELYHLISDLEYKVPSLSNRDNRMLLRDLSQIKPRPNDFIWRWYGGVKRVKDYVMYGGLFGLGHMAIAKLWESQRVK